MNAGKIIVGFRIFNTKIVHMDILNTKISQITVPENLIFTNKTTTEEDPRIKTSFKKLFLRYGKKFVNLFCLSRHSNELIPYEDNKTFTTFQKTRKLEIFKPVIYSASLDDCSKHINCKLWLTG